MNTQQYLDFLVGCCLCYLIVWGAINWPEISRRIRTADAAPILWSEDEDTPEERMR